MTLLDQYEQLLKEGKLEKDSAQRTIVLELCALAQKLNANQNFLHQVLRKSSRLFNIHYSPIKGLYLWGGVGRGKTMLMDLFFEHLTLKAKKRVHFHRFMNEVHQQLHSLQGHLNPLRFIAKRFSKNYQVLCFDEFFVSDIADAMILSEFLKALFYYNVTLVATSNIHPTLLYENGLQRNKFLPAITRLQQHTTIIELKTAEDYRMQFLSHAQLYYFPLGQSAEQQLLSVYQRLVQGRSEQNMSIEVNQRQLLCRYLGDTVVWFDFEVLCQSPRNASDYIEISKCFHTVILSNVITMTQSYEDCAKRFIVMIDEFYQRNVTLIMSAQSSLDTLYQGKRHQQEFARTLSRLNEMQSSSYLSKPHLG